MDIIELKSIKLSALIGVYAIEQAIPQTIIVDIAYGIPPQAFEGDMLGNTIDYDAVIHHIKTFVCTHAFHLLETLAEQLIQDLFITFPTPWIKLSIHKPFANLQVKEIILTIERSRATDTNKI